MQTCQCVCPCTDCEGPLLPDKKKIEIIDFSLKLGKLNKLKTFLLPNACSLNSVKSLLKWSRVNASKKALSPGRKFVSNY